MYPTVPTDNPPTLFKSLSALRAAHTRLLREYEKYDEVEDNEKLPADFTKSVEGFLHQAGSSGALLDVEEDRADAQALLNYWTTVLYNSGQAPRPVTLARFEEEIAAKQIGERCPYPGLKAFNREDRVVFYGRRELVREMTNRLAKENFVAVVGLSGSGKSSVVKAGLISELQEGAVPGSDQWTYFEPIVPGSQPLRSLAELTRPADVAIDSWHQQQAKQFLEHDAHLLELLSRDNKTTVVVVDQFEELFTLCRDETARRAFVLNLVRLATNADRRHIVIVTMRSEFDSYVTRYPELYELFERAQVRVPPLSPIALRKAVEKPAERAGLSFEGGLVEELVQQVLGEPAGLPLLQFTLYKLWEKRAGKSITWDSYRQLGGSPREVLAKVADEVYGSFNLFEDRNISQAIMLKIVRPGAGLDITSSRVTREELHTLAARDNVDRVLQKWVEAGLLRVTAASESKNDQIEVMHEALIRNWPRLVAWVEEKREIDRHRLQLTSAAQQWLDHDRDPGGLLGGKLLEQALSYDDLNEVEGKFVEESLRAAQEADRERKAREQRELRMRWWFLRIAAACLLIGAFLLGLAAWKTWAVFDLEESVNAKNRDLITAQQDLKTAQQNLDFSRRYYEATATEAAQRLNEVHKQTATELEKLEEYKRQAAHAQKLADTAEARVRGIEAAAAEKLAEAKSVEQRLQNNVSVLSAALAESRPALLINDGHFAKPPVEWSSKLESRRAQIEKSLRSVGRLEVDEKSSPTFIGTAFLVGPRLALAFYGPSYSDAGFLIDFRDKPDSEMANKFRATVLGVIKEHHVAVLSLEPQTASGLKLPEPLILARHPTLKPGNPLYIAGYPARDTRTPDTFLNAIFENIYDVKRVQPGYLLSLDDRLTRLYHDCFTVGGNSGSPLIDLESGKVVGLHIGGPPASASGTGEKYAVPLWQLADRPEMIKAGVTFQ